MLSGLSEHEIYTFFAVLIRYATILAIIPFLGSQSIPAPVKVLLSLAITVVVYPILVERGWVNPSDAAVWTATTSGILLTVGREVLVGLAIGFCARVVFMMVEIGGDIMGNLMGFASASLFDPHQESQTQVVTKVQTTLAMLLFLASDGHHLLIRSVLETYRFVGLGAGAITGAFAETMMTYSSHAIRTGMQIAAPMALTIFSINIVYGIIAKAMPQMNILVLSFSVTTFIGLFVMMVGVSGFSQVLHGWFGGLHEQIALTSRAMAQ